MKQSHKLLLDILMGAVVPILILNYLSRRLGAPTAYVTAALVPVGWVAIDLFFITRRLNMITVITGLNAMASGALAFWFVDGVRYALKDSAALIVSALIFGGSIVIGRPVLQAFFRQIVNPDTPERERALGRLLGQPNVRRALTLGTLIVTAQSVMSAIINFFLNLRFVEAAFGSETFNQQVASVNAMTRVLFPILSLIAFFAAIWITYRAIFMRLPAEEGKHQMESDFWTLVEMWEQDPGAEHAAVQAT